jgi:hypothetical protein
LRFDRHGLDNAAISEVFQFSAEDFDVLWSGESQRHAFATNTLHDNLDGFTNSNALADLAAKD